MAPNTNKEDAAAIIASTTPEVRNKLADSFNNIPSGSIRVEDKVYNAAKLAEKHPGGPLFVKAFAGRDATQAFLSYHRRRFPHSIVKHALEEELKDVKFQDNEDYWELIDRVHKVIPRLGSFAPWHYYLKVAFIMGMTFYLEFYMHYYAHYKWYLTSLLGFFFAMIGLNIQHDANHGAVSIHGWVNRLLGGSVNWIGSSAVDWIHQHVVQHHIHTNDIHLDPDIEGTPLYRLNPATLLLEHHTIQHVYYFFLMALYGWTTIFFAFINNINGNHFTKFSVLLGKERIFETCTIAFFYFRWIFLPIYQVPSIWTVLNVIPLMIVAGHYLAFFFIISHNFEGVYMKHETRPGIAKDSFLFNQVTASSNVGGSWLCFLNGGLNYQIEHHLFPRMNHNHYPTIAPIVRQFCEEKHIPYRHFPTVGDNFRSCVNHLFGLGHEKVPHSINWG